MAWLVLTKICIYKWLRMIIWIMKCTFGALWFQMKNKWLEFGQTMINNQLRTLGALAAIVYKYKRFHLGKIYNMKLFLTCCIQLFISLSWYASLTTKLSILMCVEVLWRCRSWAVCRADTGAHWPLAPCAPVSFPRPVSPGWCSVWSLHTSYINVSA